VVNVTSLFTVTDRAFSKYATENCLSAIIK